jgi:hypothetical protein
MSSHHPSRQPLGRTQGQLLRLPPNGAVYVVPQMGMASYCAALLKRAGRDPENFCFLTLARVSRSIVGLQASVVVDIDHHVLERTLTDAEAEAVDLIRAHQAKTSQLLRQAREQQANARAVSQMAPNLFTPLTFDGMGGAWGWAISLIAAAVIALALILQLPG